MISEFEKLEIDCIVSCNGIIDFIIITSLFLFYNITHNYWEEMQWQKKILWVMFSVGISK